MLNIKLQYNSKTVQRRRVFLIFKLYLKIHINFTKDLNISTVNGLFVFFCLVVTNKGSSPIWLRV